MKSKGFLIFTILLLLIIIATILIINRNAAELNDKKYEGLKLKAIQKYKTSRDCFNSIDTSKQLAAKGCINHFYSKINNETILSVLFPSNKLFTGCSKFTIEPPFEQDIQLLIYEKNKAHLKNFCTCLVPIKSDFPIDTFNIISAKMIIGGNPPPNAYYNNIPFKTIKFEEALFRSKSGEEKHIKDILIWNVHDVGPTG